MKDTLLSHWQGLVRKKPGAIAVIEAATGLAWSRQELDDAAVAWARALPGSVRGRRVTFALPNGAGWFAALLGLWKAGAIPVPLDASEPVEAQRRLAGFAGATWAWIHQRLERIGPEKRTRRSPHCLVKLTSGSTGRPRALAFADAQMMADGRQVCVTMRIRPGDVNFAVIPLGHSYGLGNLVVPLLAQGTALVCASVPLPQVIAAEIARWRPTVFPAVPALLRALAMSDVAPEALAGLRTVISAGSPLPAAVARQFRDKFKLRPHSFYGSSETGGITYDRTGHATLAGRSVGTPLVGVTITPVRGGRFRISSPAVHGRGRFSPADLGSWNEAGELVLQGRAGRLIKVVGRRLDLGDFERELRALPGVHDAFASRHPENPDELAAVLATSLDRLSLRSLLRRELAPWKFPRRLVLIPEFPLTARGKTDQGALRALLAR